MTENRLFCCIRKEWVASLPEEIIRQKTLFHMIKERGFPASLIAVEQPLKQLPHLSLSTRSRIPNRRADIICFTNCKGVAPLHPLLMIECKSVKLTPSVMNQILGYNHFIGSKFIALVSHQEVRMGWYDPKLSGYAFIDFLPSYEELIHSLYAKRG